MKEDNMKQGWEIKKLGEVCEVLNGYAFDSNLFTDDNTCVPIIRIRDIKRGYTETFYKGEYAQEYIINKGNYLIGMDGEFNIAEWSGKDSLLNQRVCKLSVVSSELIKRFVLWYMPIALKQIEDETPFVTVKHLSSKKLLNIPIPVPPLPVQEQIVSELDLLSGIIEKKREQLKELDALAQSIFYDMFGDPITNEKGWEVKKLGEVCDVRDGTHDSPNYLLYSDYVLITSKNITNDGNIDFSSANYISKEDYDSINKRSYVESGDIIMAMIGTIGKPIIVKETDIKFCIKNVALIKFGCSTMVINTYIKAMLNNSNYGQYILSQNKGGTQKFIALGTIRNLPISLPSIDIQHQFASKIEAIERQKELIKQSISETETLFNERMQHYFG